LQISRPCCRRDCASKHLYLPPRIRPWEIRGGDT
jgi:hypothetical protein